MNQELASIENAMREARTMANDLDGALFRLEGSTAFNRIAGLEKLRSLAQDELLQPGVYTHNRHCECNGDVSAVAVERSCLRAFLLRKSRCTEFAVYLGEQSRRCGLQFGQGPQWSPNCQRPMPLSGR